MAYQLILLLTAKERKDEVKSKADLSRLIKDGFPNPTESKKLGKNPMGIIFN